MIGSLPCSQVTYIRRHPGEFILVTDDGVVTADAYLNMATAIRETTRRCESLFRCIVSHHLAVPNSTLIIQPVAYRAQTTTAIDRTQHSTARDIQRHASCHVTGSVGFTAEATTATEDVTVHIRCAPGTNHGTVVDVHRHITQHMAVLTTTEYGAVDSAARDGHIDMAHVGLLIEYYTWVALTGAKEIAGYGVSGNLTKSTRHTDGTTRHRNSTVTCHVGQLVTSIDISQDMAAPDFHQGVATHITGLPVPFTCGVWEVTGSATEDVAIEGAAVISNKCTSLRIIFIGIYIVGSIFSSAFSLSILPTCTFGQRIFIAGYTCEVTIRPLCVCITTVKAISSSSFFI